jgi:hypothetical protein
MEEELRNLTAICMSCVAQTRSAPYKSHEVTSLDRLAEREPKTRLAELYPSLPRVCDFQKPHVLTDARTREFAGRPLEKLSRDFCQESPSRERIEDALPFTLERHPASRPHAANEMLTRLASSMQAYAEQARSRTDRSLSADPAQLLGHVRRCLQELDDLRVRDSATANGLSMELVELANRCTAPDDAYWLQRCAVLDCPITLHHALAATMSADVEGLRKVNSTLSEADCAKVTQTAIAFELHVNRVSQANRCIGLCQKLIGELTKESPDPKLVASTDTMLAQTLCMRRALQPLTDVNCLDPRQIVFEFINGWLLKARQVDLVHDFVTKAKSGVSSVQQMLMGEGKTTCIAPLLALHLADTRTLVTQVVPDALLEQSRDVMWSCFSQVITKRILTLSFFRSSCASRTEVDLLLEKLECTRTAGGLVITTGSAIKSLILKFIEVQRVLSTSSPELLQDLDCAAFAGQDQNSKRLKKNATELHASLGASDRLGEVLALWKGGVLLADEVDMLLHPLQSELNFPVGGKSRLEPWDLRWGMSIALLEPFFADRAAMDGRLREFHRLLEDGKRARFLQAKPHLILLNDKWYQDHLRPILSKVLLEWLLAHQRDGQSVLACAGVEGTNIEKHLNGEQDAAIGRMRTDQIIMLNLGRDLLKTYIPHCLKKIDRVSFGLLNELDLAKRAGGGDLVPENRMLLAIPFVGKDVPAETAEFAHPDVVISLTVLAYNYEGLRRDHVRMLARILKEDHKRQLGKTKDRPAQKLLDTWIAHACHRLGREKAQFPLEYFQIEDEDALTMLYELLRESAVGDIASMADGEGAPTTPSPAKYLLTQAVFPRTMKYQTLKLSACGQELGSDMIFGARIGFSGTPSNLLPRPLGACGFEKTSEGRILSTLCKHVSVEYTAEDWNVETLLENIARAEPPVHALIDTGALITGMNNLEVAHFLLEHGLRSMQGVVFLDDANRQMVLLRSNDGKPVRLADCGLAREKRFTFYVR